MNIQLKRYLNKSTIKYWLAVVPIALLGLYLYKHSINVPFWDQWEIVPILEHLKTGRLTFHDFWQQHNEHRLLFPRLLMISSAALTHWDLRAEILISFVLAIISFGILLKVIKLLQDKKKFTIPFLLPLVLSGIWFSLLQFENWLWGWQIQWYLNVLGVTIVIYALSKIIEKPEYSKIILAISGAFLAQYSLGNGVLIWPLLIAALIVVKVNLKKVSIVAAASVFSTVLYYLNYKDPVGDPSKTLVLEKPLDFIKYVAAYLGRPLSYNSKIAMVMGVISAAVFTGICIYLFLRERKRFDKLTPIIVLGLYAIGSAIITGLSRLGFGVQQAMSNRYTTISSLLLVSIIVIIVYNRDLASRVLERSYKPFSIFVTAAVISAVILNMNSARRQADVKTQYLKDIKSCTSAKDPYEVCLLSSYPNKDIVIGRLEYLKDIHWGGY